eukprot:TCALIF_11067-PA protein Name:"Protein of unknown function" AED:0.18 eAED:0.19 QI:0/0.33/0.5/1/0.66/0.5/4/717/78
MQILMKALEAYFISSAEVEDAHGTEDGSAAFGGKGSDIIAGPGLNIALFYLRKYQSDVTLNGYEFAFQNVCRISPGDN